MLRFLLCLVMAFGVVRPSAVPAAEPGYGRVFLAAAPGERQLGCDEIRQRYVVGKSRLNTRTLNFLFFDAAEEGCLDLVKRFLAIGASVRARDRFGNTALLLAARSGETDAVTLLLENGSDIDQRNLGGSTALLRAVTMNRRRTAKVLLAAGADADSVNRRGISPLTAAIFSIRH